MISRRRFIILVSALVPTCKTILAHRAEWDRLTAELSRTLANLQEGQFLTLEKKDTGYYVQFAGHGGFGIWAEAVSNGYLDSDRRLCLAARSKLLALGWYAPTRIPDRIHDLQGYKHGCPNYFCDFGVPVPYMSVANLAVSTLRTVFGAMHPADLQYSAFSNHDGNIEFPNLRLRAVRAPIALPYTKVNNGQDLGTQQPV